MKLTRRVMAPPGVIPGVLNALLGARALLHPLMGARGFLCGTSRGGYVSGRAFAAGGKEEKLRPRPSMIRGRVRGKERDARRT